jgi:glycosyltransferase involved in cell wall biosynthesis
MSAAAQKNEDYRPNIVMFARHFPPHVSGGARRPYYLAKALQALGCRVFVIAPALPEDIEGYAVAHVQPDPQTVSGGPAGIREWIRNTLRNWLLWPDPDIRWTRRAARIAIKTLPFKPDWVITTSPPESVHFAGLIFKKKLGCHWYADLRDHWLVRPFRKQRESWLRKYIEQKIAIYTLGKADMLSAVNAAIAQEASYYAGVQSRVFMLPHFTIENEGAKATLPEKYVNLVYTGSFSLSDPDCDIADSLDVFTRAHQQNPALHLHIAGRLTEAEITQINASQAHQQITLHGVVSLQSAHALQNAADALLLAGSAHCDTPPGKAAEYASRGKPIIAITGAEWAKQFNGKKTAMEHLARLNKDTKCEPLEAPLSQTDAANTILQHMINVDAGRKT